METKTLTFIGWDYWDRAVYKDEYGKLWKDVNANGKNHALCSVTNNDFDGEPDEAISNDIECTFTPRRMTWLEHD